MQPLDGIEVLDFSTLLPGPLASLLLAEAGATVTKVERPTGGDELRAYAPRLGPDGAGFALLNRGKRSLAIDLKAKDARARLMPLIERADVLIEQFRPGVMARLGLGYEALAGVNPRLVYCSITGYGQSGPNAAKAGHDLNYVAEAGLLALAADEAGAPVVPPALLADIAGGAYPAVINVLLALRAREASGRGCHLDVAMCDNVLPFAWWALAAGFGAGHWPRPGGELLTGGSPRFQVYRTADGRFLAVGALEERFWQRFCQLIGLETGSRDDARDPEATRRRVAEIVAARPAADWATRFEGEDVCCSIVATLEEAVAGAQIRARGLLEERVITGDGRAIPALPVPIASGFRRPGPRGYPRLGEAADLLDDGGADLPE